MSVEDNKKLVEDFFDACARRDLDGAAALYADEGINHGMRVKREQIRMVLGDLDTTFGAINLEVRMLIGEGEWVVAQTTMQGQHVGKNIIPIHMLTPGTEPTGKPFRVQVIHMFRIQDGKITEHWAGRDDLGLHYQIGLIPMPDWYKARMG
jgi:ketosteroid isomerase-like protein